MRFLLILFTYFESPFLWSKALNILYQFADHLHKIFVYFIFVLNLSISLWTFNLVSFNYASFSLNSFYMIFCIPMISRFIFISFYFICSVFISTFWFIFQSHPHFLFLLFLRIFILTLTLIRGANGELFSPLRRMDSNYKLH